MRMTVLITCCAFAFGSTALGEQSRVPTTAPPLAPNATAARTQSNRPNMQRQPAQGVIEGYVYWGGGTIKHSPPNSCSGLSVTASIGSTALTATTTFAYAGSVGNNAVCRYSVKGLPI